MSQRKRILATFIAVALAVGTPNLAAAEFEDEQWPSPNDASAGSHIVSIADGLPGNLTYSQLTAYRGADTLWCKSVDDANCKGASDFQYVAMLPACENANELDCIEGLTSTGLDAKVSVAEFDRYTYEAHPNMFSGNAGQTISNPSAPSVWKMPAAPHAFGSEYALAVSLSGGFNSKGDGQNQLNMNLYAVSQQAGVGERLDGNGFTNIARCNQAKDSSTGRLFLQCGAGAEELGLFRCALKVQQSGGCLLQRAFPAGNQFKVALRLSEEPTGWFHGRMKTPTIQIEKLGKSAVKLSVQAAPTKVPIFYQSASYSQMPPDLKSYWDTCLAAKTCPSGTRIFGNDPNTEPDGNVRNAIHGPPAYGTMAIKAVNYFGKFAEDKAAASPSLWSARSLSSGEMNGANRCFRDGSGVKGILTTNATAYSEGPPKFTNGFLNYQVAGLHYASDGKTLNEGVYDMVMKSSVARCLYGFSAAPISASISVTSAEGEKKVATTVVSEKNGWLKLAAYGFTFSSPTISVKLSQPKVVAKKSTITCVKGKLIKKVTAVGPKCPSGYKKK